MSKYCYIGLLYINSCKDQCLDISTTIDVDMWPEFSMLFCGHYFCTLLYPISRVITISVNDLLQLGPNLMIEQSLLIIYSWR